MPVIHPWQPSASFLPVLQSLEAGGCVVLPTESTYELAASALRPDAVALLQALAGDSHPVAVVVSDDADLRDWMPLLRGVAPRLLRKLGAGPIMLRAEGGFRLGNWSRLPDSVRSSLIRQGKIAVRWPAHPVWADLRDGGIPLVSVPLPGGATIEDVVAQVRERAALMLDAGRTEHGTVPTVVSLDGSGYSVEHEGGASAELIGELAQCRILFICTGNTCRSPMAEALCATLLAEALGCQRSELKRNGFCVQSAGLSAMMGAAASPEAVQVVAGAGADLNGHRSQMVTMQMLAWADHVFAMTSGHREALASVPIAGLVRPRLLCVDGHDVADPFGRSQEDYQACAAQIESALRRRLPELLESR